MIFKITFRQIWWKVKEKQKNRENETNAKLAKIADVKPTLYKMGAKVINSDNEDIKQRVLAGEI